MEIETQWSVDDVFDAHDVLNMLDAADAELDAIRRAENQL